MMPYMEAETTELKSTVESESWRLLFDSSWAGEANSGVNAPAKAGNGPAI